MLFVRIYDSYHSGAGLGVGRPLPQWPLSCVQSVESAFVLGCEHSFFCSFNLFCTPSLHTDMLYPIAVQGQGVRLFRLSRPFQHHHIHKAVRMLHESS